MLKGLIHYIVIIGLLSTAIVLYNQQLGAIPLLLLSLYLFYLAAKQLYTIKNKR